jgi:hypothetical protein
MINGHVVVRRVLLVLGVLKSNRWNCCEKIMCARFEVGYLSSMWAFQRKLFFSRYSGVFSRIRSFGCRFWVVPEVLKIEM